MQFLFFKNFLWICHNTSQSFHQKIKFPSVIATNQIKYVEQWSREELSTLKPHGIHSVIQPMNSSRLFIQPQNCQMMAEEHLTTPRLTGYVSVLPTFPPNQNVSLFLLHPSKSHPLQSLGHIQHYPQDLSLLLWS